MRAVRRESDVRFICEGVEIGLSEGAFSFDYKNKKYNQKGYNPQRRIIVTNNDVEIAQSNLKSSDLKTMNKKKK